MGSGSCCPPRVEERSTASKDKCREPGHTKETGAIPPDRVQCATGGSVTLKKLALKQNFLPIRRPHRGERLRTVRCERQLPQMTAIDVHNEDLNLRAATTEGDEIAPR